MRIRHFPGVLAGWLAIDPAIVFFLSSFAYRSNIFLTAPRKMASTTVPSVNGLTEYSSTASDEIKGNPVERASIPTEFKHEDGAPDVGVEKHWVSWEVTDLLTLMF